MQHFSEIVLRALLLVNWHMIKYYYNPPHLLIRYKSFLWFDPIGEWQSVRVLCLLWDFSSKHFHLFPFCLHAVLEHNWELDLHTVINIINLIAIWAPPQVLQNRLCWTMLENYLFILSYLSSKGLILYHQMSKKTVPGSSNQAPTSLQYGGLLWVSLLFSLEKGTDKAINNIWSRGCIMLCIFSRILFSPCTKDAEHLFWGQTDDIHCYLCM